METGVIRIGVLSPVFTSERQHRLATLPRGSHPPHPLCGVCGRAAYKAMEPRKVKPSDPWAYCRNPGCPQFGFRAE